MATTPPVCTSSTTTDPRRPPSAAAAAACAFADSVSTTVPVTGWFGDELAQALQLRGRGSRPASSDEYFASTPTDPNWIDW